MCCEHYLEPGGPSRQTWRPPGTGRRCDVIPRVHALRRAELRAQGGAGRLLWIGLLGLAVVALLLMIRGTAASAQPRPGQPWLGVVLKDDGGPGVRVMRVMTGSPADKGGIVAGDRILRVAGGAVPNVRAVQQAVRAQRVGQGVAVRLRRGARTSTVRLKLEAMPTYASRVRKALLGRKAPRFSVQRADGVPGQILDNQAFLGKVVLLEFWASWCGACRSVVPLVKALHAQYHRFGLEILAIAGDPVSRIAPLAQALRLPYKVGSDPRRGAFRAFHIRPIPAFVLLDRKGVVRAVAVGAGWGRDLRAMLLTLHGLLMPSKGRGGTRGPSHKGSSGAAPARAPSSHF